MITPEKKLLYFVYVLLINTSIHKDIFSINYGGQTENNEVSFDV